MTRVQIPDPRLILAVAISACLSLIVLAIFALAIAIDDIVVRGTFMLGWWRRRKELKARVSADATAMISEHGGSAYWVARDRALEKRLHKVIDAERTTEYWDRVRFEIRKQSRRKNSDTATRYLEDRR